jgi:glutamyl/glutaminyl-tRNA synthetase
VDSLVEQGKAYPCFCTDEELQQMKAEAEAKSLPPIYRGKWASASQEEVQLELAKVGADFTSTSVCLPLQHICHLYMPS